jgi:hypothetical protein
MDGCVFSYPQDQGSEISEGKRKRKYLLAIWYSNGVSAFCRFCLVTWAFQAAFVKQPNCFFSK